MGPPVGHALGLELGLSQGSIYNYFKDKKELALEVMTGFCDLWQRKNSGWCTLMGRAFQKRTIPEGKKETVRP